MFLPARTPRSLRGDERNEMTTAADDDAVEGAFEAYLAGRPVPEGATGLVAFADGVRATAARPGRPNAALAELLATGLLIDQSSPSTRTAPTAGSSAAADARRRRRVPMFLSAFIAKIASAGAVAQAAAGAGIVVAAVAGAGVAGVLPEPVTETVSTVLGIESAEEETAEEETAEEGTQDGDEAGTDGGTDTSTGSAEEDGEGGDADTTGGESEEIDTTSGEQEVEEVVEPLQAPEPGESLGHHVSENVHHPDFSGQRVREWAHDRNEARQESRGKSSDEGSDTDSAQEDGDDSSEVETPKVEDEVEDEDEAPAAGRQSNSGKGGKGGHGRG